MDKARANDLKAYLARRLRNRLAWEHANKDKVLATAAGVRARAIASRAHECQTCNISLQSAHALKIHLASKAHREQLRLATGGKPKTVSAEVLRWRTLASKNKANRTYYCAICDKAFNIKGHLDKHLNSKRHIRNAAAATP